MPGVWTHTINKHFEKNTKLPCSLVFKRGKITREGVKFASVVAKCKDCASVLNGIIQDEPDSISSVTIEIGRAHV